MNIHEKGLGRARRRIPSLIKSLIISNWFLLFMCNNHRVFLSKLFILEPWRTGPVKKYMLLHHTLVVEPGSGVMRAIISDHVA